MLYRSVLAYGQLFRIDAALIAFFSYLAGAGLAGAGTVGYQDVSLAGAVTLISTNFIYSLNSWADREIDSIDKPGRPIPSGRVTPKDALIYAGILLILSSGYPFWVYRSFWTLCLFLLLPLLGLIYSIKPVRTRDNPYLAVLTISTGLVIPIMLGYFMNNRDFTEVGFFIVLFLFCLGVVPLKQIEEVEPDELRGAHNLYLRFGKRILYFSLGGMLLVLLLAIFLEMSISLKILISLFAISVIGCIFFYLGQKKNVRTLYQHCINTIVAEGVIFFLIMRIK